MTMQMLSIDTIKLDERCQPRATINPEIIDEYAEAMKGGAEFPPLTVYRDGGTFFLADGFHRIAAARQAGQAHVVCEVIPGTIRDAILHAVGANATHGQRRTNLDKRRAVETLLKDDEWSKWSDSEIARRCSVDHKTVARIRQSLGNSQVTDERTYTDRYGNTRTMNTANIGRKPTLDVQAPDIASQMAREAVDPETGEILNSEPPPYEEVDPTDPASYLPPPRPISDARRAPDPIKRPEPSPMPASVEFATYGPEYDAMTFRSLALSLDAVFGDGFAERFGRWVRTKAA